MWYYNDNKRRKNEYLYCIKGQSVPSEMFTVALNIWSSGGGRLRMNLTQLLMCRPQAATGRAWTAGTARGTACGWRRTAWLTMARSVAAPWCTPTSPPAPTTWSHWSSKWVSECGLVLASLGRPPGSSLTVLKQVVLITIILHPPPPPLLTASLIKYHFSAV